MLVDNDVNLMALGEHATMYPDVEQMVFVKVATGIGAGIISGGRLHRGAQGAAGDLGHVAALHGGGIPCTCGNIGCLEAVASGPAVVRALLEPASTPATPAASSRWRSPATSPRLPRCARPGARSGTSWPPASPCSTPRSSSSAGCWPRPPRASSPASARSSRAVAAAGDGEVQIVASRTAGHAGVIGAATMVIQHVLAAEQVEVQISSAAAG